jgi:OmpA-OmpF porin, OOP family
MKKLLLGVVMALSAAVASAQDAGFYVGGHFGQAKAKDACDGVSGPGISCEDNDTAWKVLAGFQVNKHFAVELGYADFGEVAASGPGGTIKIEATAFEAVGIGMLPVADRFSVYGKLGVYRGETDMNINTVLLQQSESESNTDVTFGFGARFDFTKQLAGRVEWQRYQDVGGGEIGESHIDLISIGVLFRF